MANLVDLRRNIAINGTFNAKIIRDGGANPIMVITFDAQSKHFPGTGDDNLETVIAEGDLQPASPIAAATLTSDTVTKFAFAARIFSKKPRTGMGEDTDSLRFISENIDDASIKSAFDKLFLDID